MSPLHNFWYYIFDFTPKDGNWRLLAPEAADARSLLAPIPESVAAHLAPAASEVKAHSRPASRLQVSRRTYRAHSVCMARMHSF